MSSAPLHDALTVRGIRIRNEKSIGAPILQEIVARMTPTQ